MQAKDKDLHITGFHFIVFVNGPMMAFYLTKTTRQVKTCRTQLVECD
jgi:hypothetical protein